MNWFKGEIAEAVVKSKTQNAVFVVYVEGLGDESTRITQIIDNEDVSAILSSDKFVAIRIEANSVPYQQFSQIYKQVPIPSVYFIGKQGVPLDIIEDVSDCNTFLLTINKILERAGLAPVDLPRSTPENVVCENGVCTLNPGTSSTSSEISLAAEEKVEHVKQILNEKRDNKRREEEESERLKEIERRKMGQNVQQLKRWQEDQELKQILEQRQKEKRENQAAKQRVLDQIAQDKAERAAKFSPSASTSQQPTQSHHYVVPRSNSDTARIQFRLPDGRTTTNDFSSKDTLEAVHSHIRADLNLPFTQYTLSTTFPRREYSDLDRGQTLESLGLVPTAVILILPINRSGTVSTNTGGGFSAIFWSLLAPLVFLFSYLKSFIFGSAPKPDGNKRTIDNSNENQRSQPKVRRAGETTIIRRQGNIHRLSNKNDSDDENNTWNGNSTQQM